MRPCPGSAPAPYDDKTLIAPDYSPHVFIETAKGTIEFELAVLDAPQTSRNFMTLARKGFFNGLAIHRVVPNFVVQDGDSRGDGTAARATRSATSSTSVRSFAARSGWRCRGRTPAAASSSSSTHRSRTSTPSTRSSATSSTGMDVVDQIQQGDVIQRVRVWDGRGWQ